jgi:hypothetical protein
MADIPKVTERVNNARAACNLSPIGQLPQGERRNPCFCPLGRALRRDMGDSFFLAVGTRHIRLASTDGTASEIARRFREAWGVADANAAPGSDQFVTIPLPSEMSAFVVEFDAGKLPGFEGQVEQEEKVRFAGVPRRLWNVTADRGRRVRRLGAARESKAVEPTAG